MRHVFTSIWNFFFFQLPPLDEEARRWVEGLPKLEGAGKPPQSLKGAIAEPTKK